MRKASIAFSRRDGARGGARQAPAPWTVLIWDNIAISMLRRLRSSLGKLPAYAAPLAGSAGLALFFVLLAVPGGDGGLKDGAAAPDFALTDLAGRNATLGDYRGKVLLLDFWATYCDSCRAELPALKALHQRFQPKGFELLAASMDEAAPEAVARYAADFALPFRVVFAEAEVARAYRVFGLPTKYLIDADGRIYRRYLLETEPRTLERDIETLLARRKP